MVEDIDSFDDPQFGSFAADRRDGIWRTSTESEMASEAWDQDEDEDEDE